MFGFGSKSTTTAAPTVTVSPVMTKEGSPLTEDTISDLSSDGIEGEGIESNDGGATDNTIIVDDNSSSDGVMKQAFSFIKNHLKVGSDMTKMPIPATFVAPMSFLVAIQQHSAIFTNVLMAANSIKDPEQRFLQVLRYHMTWPKMFFPKNPLNPILGEIYECEVNHIDEKTNLPAEGDKTKFIAEQISHHPPISAFHFSNEKHGITMESRQQITPVFKGKHIRAHMDVKTCTTLKNHNETYINDKFPDGFLRLLRWKFEFTGKYTFQCPESGYNAVINFKDKPILGGKWHDLHILVSKGSDALYEITGTHIDILNMTNLKDKSTSVFLNYNTVRQDTISEEPLEQLKENNSLKVWKGVADAFAKRDGRRAGLEKQKIEEAQRRKAKAALAQNPNYQWTPVHFETYTPENPLKPEHRYIGCPVKN
ncbi:oxysterol binding family protein [Heterostelium album PN500]|uniref:Oxysterol binding family protein n=1 Tax=Heterostelium pallidum (strain ATCC 26659 / Pp 5 / PN500) TaxID=670386 RepID=D3AWM1_HETP5|nr:oxysterol binding family protein [Heterostelium album PN500]EFA86694.1 oxysterol binding family protein [Heterostelium album PN500]|eukprot:XP_020438798.1 oxysterol binding family protein [Heterostelium album PN500]